MEKVEIDVCIRPYFHDVKDTIVRKPKYNKTKDRHFVTYKGKEYPLGGRIASKYVIWVEE